jgi:hypothetical protein
LRWIARKIEGYLAEKTLTPPEIRSALGNILLVGEAGTSALQSDVTLVVVCGVISV